MKTIVYVDGLNLYYGSLRGTAFKWLDLYALFRDNVLEADADVDQIRYYTAPTKADDPTSPQRQQRSFAAMTEILSVPWRQSNETIRIWSLDSSPRYGSSTRSLAI